MSRSNTEFIKQRHGKAQGSRADLAEDDGNVSCVEEWTGSQRCVSGQESMTRPDRGLQERCLFIVTVLMRCRCLESELWGK